MNHGQDGGAEGQWGVLGAQGKTALTPKTVDAAAAPLAGELVNRAASYVVLGMIMEELSMVLLTTPVFFPIVTGLGFEPVWFGVLIVLVVQIGLIIAPVGMNLFVLNSLLKGVRLGDIFRGLWLFVLALVAAQFLVLEFQPLTLWLPRLMR